LIPRAGVLDPVALSRVVVFGPHHHTHPLEDLRLLSTEKSIFIIRISKRMLDSVWPRGWDSKTIRRERSRWRATFAGQPQRYPCGDQTHSM